jgi:hypothetical protein
MDHLTLTISLLNPPPAGPSTVRNSWKAKRYRKAFQFATCVARAKFLSRWQVSNISIKEEFMSRSELFSCVIYDDESTGMIIYIH